MKIAHQLTDDQLSLMRRLRCGPWHYLKLSDADFKVAVSLGKLRLASWPDGDSMISLTASGLAALENLATDEHR